MSKPRQIIRLFFLLALTAGIVATIIYLRPLLKKSPVATAVSKDRYSIVKRGEFTVSIELEGNLDAIEQHRIRPAPGSGKHGLEILQMVEDRSQVKKGDILFKFSDEKHQQQEEQLLLQLDDERTSLMLAEEDLEMTRVANLNSIKTTTDQLRAAQEALDRYNEEDAIQKRRTLIQAIDNARNKLEQNREAVTTAKAAVSDAYMQDASKVPELEKKVTLARQNVEKTQAEVDKALSALRIFKQYDHPQKMRTLQEAVTKQKMSMQKVLVDAASRVVKSNRQIQNHKTRISQKEAQLDQLRKIRSQLTLTAPVSGIITLGNPNRRHWQPAADLKVGSQVRQGQIIASIPDLSAFVISIDLPEELRARAALKQKVVIRSKAIPSLVIHGILDEIAPMAQHMIVWDKSSPKIYPSKISTKSTDPRLMPGMTMRIEIIVEEVNDVLYVPVEAIYNREGTKYCRIKGMTGPEERTVTTGRTSNDYVEIVSGVNEGDKVLLHKPGIRE